MGTTRTVVVGAPAKSGLIDASAGGPRHEEDRNILRAEVQKLRKPPKGTLCKGSPAMRGLLAVPPKEAQERLFMLVASYQLVAALVLSAAMGFAMDPLDVDSLPPDSRTLGHLYNVLMSVMVVVSVMVTSTMTWGLSCIVTLTEETVHDAIARGVGPFVYQEGTSAFLTFLVIAQVVIASWIHSPPLVAKITTGAAVALNSLLTREYLRWAVPSFVSQVPWITGPPNMGDTSCYGRGSKAVHAHTVRVGETLVMNAAKHLGTDVCAALEDTNPVDTNTAEVAVTENEAGLRALVSRALADSEQARIRSVARALLRENMTIDTLHDACAAGGSMLLFAAMDIDGLALRRGDRLRLVSAVLEDVRKQDTSATRS